MTERFYRLIIGSTLLVLLYFKLDTAIYIYIAWLLFEGVTNFRIPRLISIARYGKESVDKPCGNCKFDFEAERMLRIVVAAMLFVTIYFIPDQAWFFPWFVGFMLTLAGISNLCPMVMGLMKIGFRD